MSDENSNEIEIDSYELFHHRIYYKNITGSLDWFLFIQLIAACIYKKKYSTNEFFHCQKMAVQFKKNIKWISTIEVVSFRRRGNPTDDV